MTTVRCADCHPLEEAHDVRRAERGAARPPGNRARVPRRGQRVRGIPDLRQCRSLLLELLLGERDRLAGVERPLLKPWYRLSLDDGCAVLRYAGSVLEFEGAAAKRLL